MEQSERARRPLCPRAQEPYEGKLTSPSNPTKQTDTTNKVLRHKKFAFRCTDAELAKISMLSQAAGRPAAELVREAILLKEPTRKRPPPKVNADLLLAVSRYGGNLNQVTRWLNTAVRAGHASQIEALRVITSLVSIERQLAQVIDQHREVS